MKTSLNGLNFIKQWEGYRDTAYQCSAGVWTIGYGHTSGVKQGDTCTTAEAHAWLEKDVTIAELAVDKYVETYHLNQNQYDALVSFTFNCGTGNLSLLTQSGKKPFEQMMEDMLLYVKAAGETVQGLINRRHAERKLFDTPVSVEYYNQYFGTSFKIDEIFEVIGAAVDYDKNAVWNYSKRAPIAAANGIPKSQYVGSYEQNMLLINLAKKGILKRAS